mgnify:CR=1 FL=1
MFRVAGLTLATAVILTGCLKTDGLLQRDPTANQYYKLDTQDLRLCRGETTRCFAFAPIASARTLLRPMEEQYGQRVAGPNYPVNFARMLLNPPNNNYTAERQPDGRFYHLPMNDHTNAAWTALEEVYRAYYDN